MEKTDGKLAVQVRAEMESSIKSGNAKSFFNNFNFQFNHYRDICEATKTMDKVNRDSGFTKQGGHSDIFINQTARSFFSQVDSISESLGYSPEETRHIADEKNDKFYKELAPKVFIKLIEMGYTQMDLVK